MFNDKTSIYLLFALIKYLGHAVPHLFCNFSGLKEFSLDYFISVAFFVLASAYVLCILFRVMKNLKKTVEIFGCLIGLSSPPSYGDAGAYTEKVMGPRQRASDGFLLLEIVSLWIKNYSVWLGKERCWEEICENAQGSEYQWLLVPLTVSGQTACKPCLDFEGYARALNLGRQT